MVAAKLIALIVASAFVVVSVGAAVVMTSQTPTTVAPKPGTAPTVTFASPLLISSGTPLNTKIVATFSKEMDPASITTSTIMADQSISLATGATLDGRALARIGAVTLDACSVTKPSA